MTGTQTLLAGMLIFKATLENISTELNIRLSYNPAIPLLGRQAHI